MRRSLIFPCLIFTCPALPAAPAPDPTPFQRLLNLDSAQLEQLAPTLASIPQTRRPYWQAFLAYAQAGKCADSAQAMAQLRAGRRLLEDRTDADSLALRAAFLGQEIGHAPQSAMTLAPEALALFERARNLEPANPRVRLLEALHLLHTPEAFGGGPQVAIPALETAVRLAEVAPAPTDPWVPAWGRQEALDWLAYSQARAGQAEAARATVSRALALDPQDAFARQVSDSLPAKP